MNETDLPVQPADAIGPNSELFATNVAEIQAGKPWWQGELRSRFKLVIRLMLRDAYLQRSPSSTQTGTCNRPFAVGMQLEERFLVCFNPFRVMLGRAMRKTMATCLRNSTGQSIWAVLTIDSHCLLNVQIHLEQDGCRCCRRRSKLPTSYNRLLISYLQVSFAFSSN